MKRWVLKKCKFLAQNFLFGDGEAVAGHLIVVDLVDGDGGGSGVGELDVPGALGEFDVDGSG